MTVHKVEQIDESKKLETVEELNRKSRSSAYDRGDTDGHLRRTAQSGTGRCAGKRHRKPQPKEPIDKWMGEPRGKQMGQKSAKNSPRGGRRELGIQHERSSLAAAWPDPTQGLRRPAA